MKLYYIVSLASSSLLVGIYTVLMFGYISVHAGTSQDGSFTITPVTSTYDNLIGADNTRWTFTATTTADLVRGDVVQFQFPTVMQAEPFEVSSASVVSSDNITLYESLANSQNTELLTNGNFESTTTTYTLSSWSVTTMGPPPVSAGASTGRSVDPRGGSYAFEFTVPTNPAGTGYGLMQSYSGLTGGGSYTGSLYAKSADSGSVCISYVSDDFSEIYNFTLSSWVSFAGLNGDTMSCSGVLSATYAAVTFSAVTASSSGQMVAVVAGSGTSGGEQIIIDDFSLVLDGGGDAAQNGGLETWTGQDVPTSWTDDSEDNSSRNISTTTVHGGQYSLVLQTGQTGTKAITYQVLTGLTPGATIDASVYEYDTNGQGYFIVLNNQVESQTQAWNFVTNQWDANTSTMGNLWGGGNYSLALSSRNTWAQFSESMTAPANGIMYIYLVTGTTNGSVVYIDDASFLVGSQSGSDVAGVGNNYINDVPIVYGIVSSTIAAGTQISVTVGGIDNAAGNLQNMQDLEFQILAGTPSNSEQPWSTLSSEKFNKTATHSLVRAGTAIVSDSNSSIMSSSYETSATNVDYTFGFTASSSLAVGDKIVVNFPAEYSMNGLTVSTTAEINSKGTTIGSFATSTSFGRNQIILTLAATSTDPGDAITVTIGDLTNPSTADVYRPFYIYTAKANGGLVDGSYYGFEQSDYATVSPVDTVHIGGTNDIVITVQKTTTTTTRILEGAELAQVRVGVGCPDKGFFVGSRFLDSNAQVTFNNLLDCNYMIGVEPLDGTGDASFFQNYLPPSFKQVPAFGDQSVSTTLTFGTPDGFIVGALTNAVVGQEIEVRAYTTEYESWGEVFTATNYVTPGVNGSNVGYFKIPVKSGSNWKLSVESQSLDGGTSKFWPPTIPSVYVAQAGTVNIGSHAYIEANKDLVVTLAKVGGGSVQDACVGVKSNSASMFMPPRDVVCQPNGTGGNTGKYVFKVPQGSVLINVMRPGKGMPEEYPIAVGASGATKTIYLSAPDTYISVSVVDGEGNAISGAPIFAQGSNGFSQDVTGSGGTTTLFIAAGTYRLEGFAPGLGPLTSWTENSGTANDGTVVVSSGVNPSVTATVNTANFRQVTGTVTAGGSGIGGVKIGARGINGTSGGNGTETNSNGTYMLYLPTAGYYEVGGWSDETGGLPPQNVNVTNGNATANWSLNGQGTLRFEISNASNITPLFGGAFDPSTGRGNGTESWTTSGTTKIAQFNLSAGSYEAHVGSPMIGPLVEGETVTVTQGETVIVTADVSSLGELVTLSGTVTDGTNPLLGVTVWASRINGPGHYETETDDNGDYSLNVPDLRTYMVGARELGYISASGDVEVSVDGNTTEDFTMTEAASTITGQVTSGGVSVSCVWIDARKIVSGFDAWAGAPTDNGGNYELSVDNGTWILYANGPDGYRKQVGQTTVTDESRTVNISLSDFNGCVFKQPDLHAISDVSGGQVATEKVTLDIPANALGTSQSTVSVSVSDADLIVGSSGATPLATSTITLEATDSNGQSVSSFNQCINITLSYDETSLPIGFDESELQFGYWDSTEGRWKTEAATVNTTLDTMTACVNHFTDFGPVLPGVPDAPSSVSATAASASQINLTWDAEESADSYIIYRNTTGNTTFTAGDQIGTTSDTSYSDTALSAQTTYYYEVAGVNENGEGFNSDTANATTQAAAVSNSPGSSGSGSTPANPPQLPAGEKGIVINNGDVLTSSRSVTLTLHALNATQMAISNSSDFTGTSFIAYTESYVWSVTHGDGEKMVYVKFRAADGSTLVVQDMIELTGQGFDQYSAKANCPIDTEKAYKYVGNSGVYFITSDCTKRPFKDEAKFFSYFNSWSHVKMISKDTLDDIPLDTLGFMPWGPLHDPKYGAIVKTVTSPNVYLLLGNQRHLIVSDTIFTALGYAWNWIEDVASSLIDKYSDADPIGSSQTHPNYVLIKYPNSPHVYRLEPDPVDATKQIKRKIKNERVFEQNKFRWDRVVEVDAEEIYSDGESLE